MNVLIVFCKFKIFQLKKKKHRHNNCENRYFHQMFLFHEKKIISMKKDRVAPYISRIQDINNLHLRSFGSGTHFCGPLANNSCIPGFTNGSFTN